MQRSAAASRWTNEISSAFLSVSAHGELTSGAEARRAASDQLFEVLVLRPWVALNFGGTEHCIRIGTGSRTTTPSPCGSARCSPDPRADAAARWRLSKDGELYAGAKTAWTTPSGTQTTSCATPLGSDDRDAEYEAINRADPSKVPDSDPRKATYKPAVVDKPATDAMEQGGQYQRLLLALVVMLGELGAVLLLGSLSVSVLLAQMVVLLLARFAPVALVAGIVPGRGHDLFKNWARHMTTYLVRKAAYSLVLAVLLAALAALQDATPNLGWLLSFVMQSMFMWMVFLHRAKLAGTITAAVSGQHPERDTQLRRLLGIAYLARRSVTPARRPSGSAQPPSPAGNGKPSTPGDEPPPMNGSTPPPTDPGPASDDSGPGTLPTDGDRGAPPDSRRAHAEPGARRSDGERSRSSLPASGRSHPSTTTNGDDGQEREDASRASSVAKPAERHAPSGRASRRAADAPAASKRRPSDSERSSDRARNEYDDSPSPRATGKSAPPSLADELRADRAGRRPVGELGEELSRHARRQPVGELGDELNRLATPASPEGSA